MIDEVDYVELGLACANVCTTLGRQLDGKQSDRLNDSMYEAINHLTTLVNSTDMYLCTTCLPHFRSQDCGGDPEEYRREGETNCELPNFPHKG